MSWISEIFSSSVGAVVDSVGKIVDTLHTSDEEKLRVQFELSKLKAETELKAQDIELQYNKELTSRHSADMSSDSWLSKNIRPLALIYILTMYSLLSISSGFEFEVTESYVQLLGQWGMLIMSFYFGGRSVEKVVDIWKKDKR